MIDKSGSYTEIILKHSDMFRRLFWIRESGNRPGIRFGFVDKDINGAHNTYYEDGSCHLESSAGILNEYPFIIESNKDNSYYILGQASIPLDRGSLKSEPGMRHNTNIVELDRVQLGDCLGVFLYLARRGREVEALDEIMNIESDQIKNVVYQEVKMLNYMKDFSLITLILRDF